MLIVTKKKGETPLETLKRIRKSKKIKEEKLSYIGRLDPMAEGQMIVLVGDKENKERAKYLNFDKEYEAVFLMGISTDSGDILGFLTSSAKGPSFGRRELSDAIKRLKKLKSQKYPWMSGKTIGGKKMFDIYKDGETGDVKRPTQKIKIYKISNIKIGGLTKKKLEKDIFGTIPRVTGEFRQQETLENWKKFLSKMKQKSFQKISFKIKVSSGTFIRGLCENLEKSLKTPVVLYRLKRTKIFYK